MVSLEQVRSIFDAGEIGLILIGILRREVSYEKNFCVYGSHGNWC